MKLFRKLLLSLFPQELIHQAMNPASMFVSFISPKQFFSVINRKIVENFKLNLFDIGLDPFEVKVGFGEEPTLNVKDVDMYYAYNATANMNGRNFTTPGNAGTAICMVSAVLTRKVFIGYTYTWYTTFLVSIYLLTFIFAARIKVFPHEDKEKNYRWFIDVFFAFYRVSLIEAGISIDEEKFIEIKRGLLQHIQIFFMLFYFYKKMNDLFVSPTLTDSDFYQRLFHSELKKRKQHVLVNDFVLHAHAYTRVAAFSDGDRTMMKLVFPADILIRYVLQGEDSLLVAETLLGGIYDLPKIDAYVHSFLTSDEQFESFMEYILDWKLYKANYFAGIKKLTNHKFRLKHNYETNQEIDSFISSLEESESLDGVKVPESLKKESMMMDRLVNFYVTFLGGMRVARGDNFMMRLRRKDITNALLEHQGGPDALKEDALFFYGGLLYNYSKNLFYYMYAYEHIKAGNDSFHLPLRPSSKEVHSNMFLLKLFDENFITTVLQDINKKSLQVFVNKKQLIDHVKLSFGITISKQIRGTKEELIHSVYAPIAFFLQNMPQFLPTLKEKLRDKDINALKDNVYTLDLQVWRESIVWLMDNDVMLSETYGDMSILGIFSQMRETLFGFLLWYTYVEKQSTDADIDLHVAALKKIYIVDVLNLSEWYVNIFDEMIESLILEYSHILTLWIQLDDNPAYFALGVGNRMSFIEHRNHEQITSELMGEDIIWFRGYVKTITYYNKRYVIPK